MILQVKVTVTTSLLATCFVVLALNFLCASFFFLTAEIVLGWSDEVIDSYQNFKHHIEAFYMGRVEKWSRLKRVSLPTYGNYTTNYVESSFRILKDKTFQCHKSYNLVDTLTVFMKEDSFHFKNKHICRYKARLALEPAYLQVLVDYLLTNCR